MDAAFRAFHEDLIDYAGLFPPAELEMPEALANYRAHWASPESWMLARFVCPCSRLAHLAEVCEAAGAAPPKRLTVLARPAETPEQLLESLATDLDALESHVRKAGTQSTPEVLELRLPPKLKDAPALLREVRRSLVRDGLGPLRVFVEATAERKMSEVVARTIEALDEVRGEGWDAAGFKLRCGGVIAAAYPDLETVETVLAEAHRRRVPLKATAGLHHPVRHHRDDLGVDEHGFWNLFGAGLLLAARAIPEERLGDVLGETDPSSFSFTGGRFAWRDASIGADVIASGRRDAITSFGSCSFDEPREDLTRLGHEPASE
jgi:hypothetical protein